MAPEDVLLMYVRDLADYQRDALAASAVRTDPALLGRLPWELYLHVDLDCLDPSVGHANRYAAPGGATVQDVLATVDAAFAHGTVRAAALTAYEPPYDRSGTIAAAARTIAARIAQRALIQRGTARAPAPGPSRPQ
jgi:arginase family enzyme